MFFQEDKCQWKDSIQKHPQQRGNSQPRGVFLMVQGRIQDFFLGGGALVSCFTSTPIHHIVFFFGRIVVVLENHRSSQGGMHTPCTLPLDPPLWCPSVGVKHYHKLLPISSGLIQLPKGFGEAYEGRGLYPGGLILTELQKSISKQCKIISSTDRNTFRIYLPFQLQNIIKNRIHFNTSKRGLISRVF